MNRLTDELLSGLSGFVEERLGLSFPRDRWRDLERGIISASAEFGFKSIDECAGWLLSGTAAPRQIETLASHLTIGETYFFRDPKVFEALEKHVLPELINSRRETGRKALKIWSAGCATGEEPYTIAMLLHSMLPDLKNWRIVIKASDINTNFLEKAERGLYSEWSFRGIPALFRERYFSKTGNRELEISPRIRDMVDFFYLNLAKDPFPSFLNDIHGMDLIFCRNVFIYFTDALRLKAAQGFRRTLADGGWLIVGPSETSGAIFGRFASVNFPGTTLYRKTPAGSATLQTGDPYAADFCAPEPTRGLEPDAVEYAADVPPPVSTSIEVQVRPDDCSRPQASDRTYEAARACFSEGLLEEAGSILRRLLGDSPDDSRSLMLLAKIHADTGDLAEADSWCRKAIAADKLNPLCHFLHATILQEQRRPEDAVASLKKVLYLDADFVPGHFVLGNLLRAHGRGREASKCFENALSILESREAEEELPGADGMTAGRLREVIKAALDQEKVS